MDTSTLKILEEKLIMLIGNSNNTEFMDTFLEWQNERSRLNENFLKMVNELDKK